MVPKLNLKGACLWALLSITLLASGCPPATITPDGVTPTDGGTTPDKVTQALTCEKGTTCLSVGHPDARSCDILLKSAQDIKNPQVNFEDEAIGQFKYRDSRLALSFLVKKDSRFTENSFAVLVKLEEASGKLEIAQSTCYDRKGAKLEKPDVKLVIP